MFNYNGKKYDTLLFFFRLAKKIHFYVISSALDLYNYLVQIALVYAVKFSSLLGNHSIIWYI
jgi:hypothetical protein